MLAQERSAKDNTMPLSALFQLNAGEALKEQTVEAGNIDARHVGGRPVPSTNAANPAFFVNDETKGLRKGVVDTVPTGSGVN